MKLCTHLEAVGFKILCAKSYEDRFKLLLSMQENLAVIFLRHVVFTQVCSYCKQLLVYGLFFYSMKCFYSVSLPLLSYVQLCLITSGSQLLPPHIGCCQSSATSIFQPPQSRRTTTSSQHARPSGVLRRRSDGLERAA